LMLLRFLVVPLIEVFIGDEPMTTEGPDKCHIDKFATKMHELWLILIYTVFIIISQTVSEVRREQSLIKPRHLPTAPRLSCKDEEHQHLIEPDQVDFVDGSSVELSSVMLEDKPNCRCSCPSEALFCGIWLCKICCCSALCCHCCKAACVSLHGTCCVRREHFWGVLARVLLKNTFIFASPLAVWSLLEFFAVDHFKWELNDLEKAGIVFGLSLAASVVFGFIAVTIGRLVEICCGLCCRTARQNRSNVYNA